MAAVTALLLLAGALFAPLALAPAPAFAQSTGPRAVASVNDELITARDLESRIGLALLASGLEDTPRNRDTLRGPVLEEMISDAVQIDRARQLDLSATPEELAAAVAEVARGQNLSPQAFQFRLEIGGVPMAAFERSLLAQILWGKVVRTEYRPRVAVADSEVEEALLRAVAVSEEEHLRVREIFLPVVNAGAEEQAERAILQLREAVLGGADFASVAREFSRSATAPFGGDLGWLAVGSLPEARRNALLSLGPGDVSEPLREAGGWTLLHVEDRQRNPEAVPIHFLRLAWDEETSDAEVRRDHARLDGCRAARSLAEALGPGGRELAGFRLSELGSEARQALDGLPPGTASEIQQGASGERVAYMLCPPDRDAPAWISAYNRIGNQKLDALLRNVERQLRRNAEIIYYDQAP